MIGPRQAHTNLGWGSVWEVLRLYGAYKDEGNLAVDVSFLIDPEGFVVDVCNFLVGKPLIFAALTFEYTAL